MTPQPDDFPQIVRVLVEWMAGSSERFVYHRGQLEPDLRHDASLAPVNYGCLPGTHNPADGDEWDAVLVGEPRPAGSLETACILGAIWLEDGDHKLVCGPHALEINWAHPDVQRTLAWFPPSRGARWLDAFEARMLLEPG